MVRFFVLAVLSLSMLSAPADARTRHRAHYSKMSLPLAEFMAVGPGPMPSGWGVSYPNVYYNNGSVLLPGTVSGGAKGIGSINVSGGYYVNGINIANIPVQASSMPAFTGGDCTSSAGSVSLTCAPFARTGTTNTYLQPQTFNQGIQLPGLIGYVKANNGSGVTAAANVPTTDLNGPLQAAQSPAYVGDISCPAGQLSCTLPNVSTASGSYGGASSVPVFTTNLKGQITSVTPMAVVAPALTLSGTTLAPGVTVSSLTALGTVTTGVWNASPINPTYIVTGTSGTNLCLLNANCSFSGANSHTGIETFSTVNTTSLAVSGTATAPTVATSDNSTNVATTALATSKINAAIAGLPLGQGFRNRIINGDDRIDQRNVGASQSIATGSNVYTDDRWYVTAAGAAVSGQQITGGTNATPVKNRYQITGATGVTSIARCQRISSANSYDMAGQGAIFGIDLADSTLTTVNYTVGYANATDNFSTVTSITSGSFTVGSTLARYTTPAISIPSAAITGLQVCVTVGAQVSGTLVTGAAQFEMGSVATSFERRHDAVEYGLCQYYFRWLGANVKVVTTNSPQNFSVPAYWPNMRVAPSVGGVGVDPLAPGPTSANLTSYVLSNVTPYSASFDIGTSGTNVNAYMNGYRFPLSAEL